VGYKEGNRLRHVLPPRPPLSLDLIYKCPPKEVAAFTSQGHFGYFRHVLRHDDLPLSELIASHLREADLAHREAGDPTWTARAVQELIQLLRDDYQTLTALLRALQDTLDDGWNSEE